MNPRVGLPSNLVVGQTSDLLLVQVDGAYPTGVVTFGFNNEPRSITGIQKVAQIFLKILFTTQGTDVLNPGLGTGFSELVIRSNITQNPREFAQSASTYISEAVSQVKSLSGTDPASTMRDVQILGLNTTDESIQMYLKLTTAAGEFASIAIPFPQMNLNV